MLGGTAKVQMLSRIQQRLKVGKKRVKGGKKSWVRMERKAELRAFPA